MTPAEKALKIYLTLYKMIGCEAKVKTVGRYMIGEMTEASGNHGYYLQVLTEFNKL